MMGVSKKSLKNNSYKLKGSLKKCGFDRWRYVFNGVNSASGEERVFFIELSILNPALSPNQAVVYETQKAKVGAADLQAALSGNIEIEKKYSSIPPSYCSVRAGILGRTPRQFLRYFSSGEMSVLKGAFNINVGDCSFSDNVLSGVQIVTREDAKKLSREKTDVGKMEWNLKYERIFDTPSVSSKNTVTWFATGLNAKFSGTVTLDGNEYIVTPDNSFGYTDKIWGVKMPAPFLHINSARMTSVFTGNIMRDSGFALESDFDGKVSVFAKFMEDEYNFGKGMQISKYDSSWTCVKTPSTEDTPSTDGGEELHWSVSLNSKKYVLDVDVYSSTSDLIVKDYEMPEGGGTILKVLGGGSATGEIRLYKQIKKSLEIIHHAKIIAAVAEYGVLDRV